jgi:hypothetical protein
MAAHEVVHAAANSVIERRNQTVVTTACNLLKSRNMPVMFWGEAVTTAVRRPPRSSMA